MVSAHPIDPPDAWPGNAAVGLYATPKELEHNARITQKRLGLSDEPPIGIAAFSGWFTHVDVIWGDRWMESRVNGTQTGFKQRYYSEYFVLTYGFPFKYLRRDYCAMTMDQRPLVPIMQPTFLNPPWGGDWALPPTWAARLHVAPTCTAPCSDGSLPDIVIPRALPLLVRRPGAVGNVLIWSTVWAGIWWLVFCGRTWLRRRRNLCPACSYNLTGLASRAVVCPECGGSVHPASAKGGGGQRVREAP